MYPRSRAPRTAIVVGAGMVGLSTAWHLQRRGVEVTVLDRSGVGAGASWGNAGWLTPAMAMPLSDPGIWMEGPKALVDATAPLHIPARLDPRLWNFLARFAVRGTGRAWERTMAALTPIDQLALESFDEMTEHGVESWTRKGPFIVGFEHEGQTRHFLHAMANVRKAGQPVPLERLEGPQDKVSQLSDRVSTVYELEGQRFIEPGPFVEALAAATERLGTQVVPGAEVRALRHGPSGISVETYAQEPLHADVVVLATGAWLPELARPLGVRTLVQSGRGYSFSVSTDQTAQYPIYFPARKVACTPYQGRLRIAGTMEFRGPDEPLQTGRIEAILASVRPLFTNMDLEDIQDIWVGPRPVTPDGLPLVGATRSPGVFVAGGHGMWGIVLGPATGRLLAEQILTGTAPEAIRPFDPLR